MFTTAFCLRKTRFKLSSESSMDPGPLQRPCSTHTVAFPSLTERLLLLDQNSVRAPQASEAGARASAQKQKHQHPKNQSSKMSIPQISYSLHRFRFSALSMTPAVLKGPAAYSLNFPLAGKYERLKKENKSQYLPKEPWKPPPTRPPPR